MDTAIADLFAEISAGSATPPDPDRDIWEETVQALGYDPFVQVVIVKATRTTRRRTKTA